MSSQQQKGTNILKQGGILAAASLIVRLIGMLYRIPMSNILGEDGISIYSVAFEIYDIVLIISSYSLPIALSKIISTQNQKKQFKNMGKTLKLATYFAIFSGGLFAILLFVFAQSIEDNIYPTYRGIHIPLQILAPTIFIVAILGVLRGFFQGKRTMMPTAVSQIIEQIVNAFVSVIAASLFISAHAGLMYESAWGAAGGTLGTCVGAFFALLFMLFIYMIYRPVKRKKERRDYRARTTSAKSIYLLLFITIFPIILSQTVYQISGLIDYRIFQDILKEKGVGEAAVRSMIGVYVSDFRLLTSVPIALSTAMSSSMIPSVVASFTEGDIKRVRHKIGSTVKFNMSLAFPCAAGLAVLGQPIAHLLFPGYDYVLGGKLLMLGSTAVIFYALSNVTGGALQSINKMRLPVIHSAISLLAHVVLVMALLKFTDLALYSLVIGNVTFPIVVFLLNFSALKREINYRQEILKTFLCPLSASLWMMISVVLVYYGIGKVFPHLLVQVVISIGVAVFVYFCSYLALRTVTREELFDFPFGRKMYVVARKLHLMK